ncbi:MAG: CBS domain-containing protein [Deferrisomatales bacterium]
MTVKDLAKRKAGRLLTCKPEDSAERAAQLLTEHEIGALPVTDARGKLVGIVSERDLARGLAQLGGKAAALAVRELMTAEVTVCSPGESVREAMRTMGRLNIRHLPVVEGGELVGLISQRDVLKAILDDTQLEVNVLRDVARAKG